jgi:hypothetical protein
MDEEMQAWSAREYAGMARDESGEGTAPLPANNETALSVRGIGITQRNTADEHHTNTPFRHLFSLVWADLMSSVDGRSREQWHQLARKNDRLTLRHTNRESTGRKNQQADWKTKCATRWIIQRCS